MNGLKRGRAPQDALELSINYGVPAPHVVPSPVLVRVPAKQGKNKRLPDSCDHFQVATTSAAGALPRPPPKQVKASSSPSSAHTTPDTSISSSADFMDVAAETTRDSSAAMSTVVSEEQAANIDMSEHPLRRHRPVAPCFGMSAHDLCSAFYALTVNKLTCSAEMDS